MVGLALADLALGDKDVSFVRRSSPFADSEVHFAWHTLSVGDIDARFVGHAHPMRVVPGSPLGRLHLTPRHYLWQAWRWVTLMSNLWGTRGIS